MTPASLLRSGVWAFFGFVNAGVAARTIATLVDPSDLKPPPGLESWNFQLDNPTFLGWTVVAFYAVAAVACARAGMTARRSVPTTASSLPWWFVAGLLLFLGINKQLNLQTFMIVLGRRTADAGGWYVHRRLVQAMFSLVFALAVTGGGWVLIRSWREFFSENALTRLGLIILAVFVLIRASTIDHLDERIGVELHDDEWGWVLEICGSLLIAVSAFAFARRFRNE